MVACTAVNRVAEALVGSSPTVPAKDQRYQVVIRSNFKDYYDFVANLYGGGDPRIVYPRTRLTKMDPKSPWAGDFFINLPKWGSLPDPTRHYSNLRNRIAYCDYKYLIVAGKAYLLKRPIPEVSALYDRDINSFKICDAQEELETTWWRIRDDFKFGVEHQFLVDLCRTIGHPVFVINKIEYDRDRAVTINIDGQCPILGRIGMASSIDPYQMYQDIAVFVGNRMTKTPDMQPPVELSNIQKILKAGFDLRRSFRH